VNKLLAPLLKEPAVFLGAICGACIFLLTRYLSVDDSTANQVVYAVVPLLFSAIVRQFVRPVGKPAPVVQPPTVSVSQPQNTAPATTVTEPAPPIL
jgi:hypothetical protein